jgi:hypothetical protein
VTAPRTRTPSSHPAAGERKARVLTPPKGRPTPKRGEGHRALAQHTSKSWRLQWAVVAILALAVVVALVVLVGGGGAPTRAVPIGGHGG